MIFACFGLALIPPVFIAPRFEFLPSLWLPLSYLAILMFLIIKYGSWIAYLGSSLPSVFFLLRHRVIGSDIEDVL
ncbi:unnamed protein product [Camellia sinensis]